MQRKAAENLITETQELVGQDLTIQELDPATDQLRDRRVRVLANDLVLNLKPPEDSRVCLDVYAKVEDRDTGEVFHLSLDKLAKQRG